MFGCKTLLQTGSSNRALHCRPRPLRVRLTSRRFLKSRAISIGESQILIEFNRPVVPLGRMERKAEELPITVEPQANCNWRWLSTQALACNLDQKDYLKPAHEYVVTGGAGNPGAGRGHNQRDRVPHASNRKTAGCKGMETNMGASRRAGAPGAFQPAGHARIRCRQPLFQVWRPDRFRGRYCPAGSL